MWPFLAYLPPKKVGDADHNAPIGRWPKGRNSIEPYHFPGFGIVFFRRRPLQPFEQSIIFGMRADPEPVDVIAFQ
jgi:hypothetical protein